MDDKLQRQMVRQLKLLNFWVTLFGVIVVVSLIIGGFLMFKLISYVQDTSRKIETFQQDAKDTVNVKKQVCSNDKISDLLDKKTEICN